VDTSFIWVSQKRGAGKWSTKVKLGLVEWSPFANPQVSVRPDGSIFVSWVSDEDVVYRELAANASVWSAVAVLPNSVISGTWNRELEVVSSGTSVTVAGTISTQQDGGFVTWTRQNNASDWVYSEIADIRNDAVFGVCAKDIYQCGFSVGEIYLVSNESGNQVIAWQSWRAPDVKNYTLKNAVFAIFSARRASPNDAWSTPERIDMMKFSTDPNSYSYFVEGLELTAGGKSAISWTRGLGNNPNTTNIQYSNAIGTDFAKVDSAALNLGFGTDNSQLVTIGEKIWASYSYYAKESSDAVTRVGVVGALSNSKVWAPSANQLALELGVKNGFPALLSTKNDLAPKVLNISVRNADGVWSVPKAVVTLKFEIPSRFAVEVFTNNGKTVVATVGKKGQDWEMGLDLTVL
jgi:hypothetical protein